MLCFGRVCASAYATNVSAALQGAYITPFPTEVVRAILEDRMLPARHGFEPTSSTMTCPASPPFLFYYSSI